MSWTPDQEPKPPVVQQGQGCLVWAPVIVVVVLVVGVAVWAKMDNDRIYGPVREAERRVSAAYEHAADSAIEFAGSAELDGDETLPSSYQTCRGVLRELAIRAHTNPSAAMVAIDTPRGATLVSCSEAGMRFQRNS